MRINNLHRIFISTAVIGIAMFVIVKSNHRTEAQITTACQSFVLSVPPSITGGNVNISLNTTTASALAVRDVVFRIDGAVLGRGVAVNANLQWQMMWYTQYSNPGGHTIGAQVMFTDGSTCMINPVPTSLTGTATFGAQLFTGAIPSNFQGLTNQVINFGLKSAISSTTLASVDVSQYTYFSNKSATLGSITPLDGTSVLRFSTGPVAGNGNISVVAAYGGLTKVIDIPITVQAQTTTTTPDPTSSPAPTTTTSTTTSTSTASGTTSSTTPTTATSDTAIAIASAASVEAEKPLKDCVQSKLGDVRYREISTGLSRPTAAEFISINQCFASRNFVLPSGFVPVSPTKVKEQPESKDLVFEKTENITSGSTVKLSFKGKAKPNSVVLLYIYSEPLVLSTTADNNGDWSYSLEDPLEPGNHEAYAVVDKGDGTYQRSSVFGFAIATASASTANPNGYSLQLSSIQPTALEDNSLNLKYIGGIVLLTIGMLGAVLYGIIKLRRTKKNNPPLSQTDLQPTSPAVGIQQIPVLPTPEVQPPVLTSEQTSTQVVQPLQQPQVVTPTVPVAPPTTTIVASPLVADQPNPGAVNHES